MQLPQTVAPRVQNCRQPGWNTERGCRCMNLERSSLPGHSLVHVTVNNLLVPRYSSETVGQFSSPHFASLNNGQSKLGAENLYEKGVYIIKVWPSVV